MSSTAYLKSLRKNNIHRKTNTQLALTNSLPTLEKQEDHVLLIDLLDPIIIGNLNDGATFKTTIMFNWPTGSHNTRCFMPLSVTHVQNLRISQIGLWFTLPLLSQL